MLRCVVGIAAAVLLLAGCGGGLDEARRGLAEQRAGNVDSAIEHYTRAIESGNLPNHHLAAAYRNRGLAWNEKNEHQRAIEDLSSALKLTPDNFRLYANRGNSYLQQSQHDEALTDFSQLIELRPEDAQAYWLRCRVYEEMDRPSEAITDCERAVELAPENKRARRMLITLKGVPLSVQWEGIDRQLTGTLKFGSTEGQGTIEISAAGQGPSCAGSWKYEAGSYESAEKPTGSWSVSCDDGATGSGRYRAERLGVGTGTGKDDKGRTIAFTYGLD